MTVIRTMMFTNRRWVKIANNVITLTIGLSGSSIMKIPISRLRGPMMDCIAIVVTSSRGRKITGAIVAVSIVITAMIFTKETLALTVITATRRRISRRSTFG